jgi:Hint module
MIVKGVPGGDDILAGIVSYGVLTCNELPSVFTRVSAYKNWIVQKACVGNNLPSWCKGGLNSNSPPPTPKVSLGCFAGSNLVDVADHGPVRMEDLKLGDMVHIGKGQYEPIYSFGHFAPTTSATFVHVHTAKSTLRLTDNHMVFTNGHKSVPASALQVGDFLIDESGVGIRVEQIEIVQERGLYAPFTPSGKIAVNNIMVSSYVDLFDKKDLTLSLGWMRLSHHWLSHAAVFPHRLVCYHIASCAAERYNIEGISLWHAQPLRFSQWLLGGGSFVRAALVATMVFLATIVTALELLIRCSAPVMLMLLFMCVTFSALHEWKDQVRWQRCV